MKRTMKAERTEPTLISITDVAKRWTTTRQNIWNMCKDGRLPATMIGSRWYVIFDSVLEMEQPTNTPEKENEDLETLINYLRATGKPMTKDDINKLFSGHLVGNRGKKFNEAIKDSELITITKESTSGRPKEIYSLTESESGRVLISAARYKRLLDIPDIAFPFHKKRKIKE